MEIWREKSQECPDCFLPTTIGILDAEIFGNSLFDPHGFWLAFDEERAVGFVHASFAPAIEGNRPDFRAGIIFSPIIRPSSEGKMETVQQLIDRAERYIKEKNATGAFAGGYDKDAPFYTGLYSHCNPNGIFEHDTLIIDAFRNRGYSLFNTSTELRLNPAEYHVPENMAELCLCYQVFRVRQFKSTNWWDANLYRNFRSQEWNLIPRNGEKAIAGAVVHEMMTDPVGERVNDPYYTLAYIGVLNEYLRHHVGSFLLVNLIDGLRQSRDIYSIVTQDEEHLRRFLEYHSFQQVERQLTFLKFFYG